MNAAIAPTPGRQRRRARKAAHRQRFVWQGVLIIMPAILLAGFGLISLRQDRLLALQEAAQEAQRLATSLAQDSLPRALFPTITLHVPRDPTQDAASGPEVDPVWTLASGAEPRIVWLTENLTNLVFPPPLASSPQPKPLPVADLSAEQRALWLALQDSSSADASNALAEIERLLPNAPARFAALALYRAGLLHLSRNELSQARRHFERLVSESAREVSEAGYPLGLFARVQLLRHASATGRPTTERVQIENALCRQAVLDASPLSEALLDEVASVTADQRLVEAWRRVWQAHEMARQMCRQYQFGNPGAAESEVVFPTARWIKEPGPDLRRWLVAAQPQGRGARVWFVAVEEEQVRQAAARVVQAMPRPDYLDVSVSVGERALVPLPGAALPATGSAVTLFQTGLGGSGSTSTRPALDSGAPAEVQPNRLAAEVPPALTVSVHLTSPHKLYARQRVRTLWSVGMITVSVVAVLIGFTTAWRAFRRQQQLAEMKSNFVSAVSHELRAPIASIRLMSEELEDLGTDAAARSGEYHRLIVRECRRLSALIENVLDFSRHEQGRSKYEFEPADLNALVQATVKVMQPCAAERSVKLSVQAAPQTITAEADARALQQALVNLIDNALKHSPENATVTVGLDCVAAARSDGPPLRDETAPRPASGNGWVHLWVEDHGPGIPPEEHNRIFERFYRRGSELRRETPGIGLGLAIVKFVAEAHGGRVVVRSAVGQGSRFTVELPQRHPAEDEP